MRIFSLGCVVYKQTRRKQSGEECARRGEGVKEGKKGEERKGTFGVGGAQEDRGLSLSSPALKKREGEATNEVKGIEFKQFSLGKREGDPQSATAPCPFLFLSLFSASLLSLLSC